VITVIFIWKNIGYNMILFLAGLKSIPKDYYEAAHIDGAGKLQVFWNITFIYLLPTTFFVVVISLINTFKIFKVNYLLFGQYPHDKIYMIQHYLNNMFDKLEYTKLITASILFSIIIIVMMAVMMHVQGKLFEVE
jgi:multiple sugar transport system permease protein